MKNILLFLSLSLLFLLGKDIDEVVPVEEGKGIEYVLQADTSIGTILPMKMELPDEGEAYVDVESLARQYRAIGRGQRSLSVQQVFWGKNSAYRAAKRRLEILFHTIKCVYTSLPCQSWTFSSDHYIFRLRRILI